MTSYAGQIARRRAEISGSIKKEGKSGRREEGEGEEESAGGGGWREKGGSRRDAARIV